MSRAPATIAGRAATIATIAVVSSSTAVGLLASRPDSPLTPPLPPGAEAPTLLARAAEVLSLDRLPRDAAAALSAVLLFAAVAAFLYALRLAWRSTLGVGRVLIVGVLLHLLALAIPLFLSRDVYSYGIYGRMVSKHGANPYTDIPAAFADDPVYPLVSVDWIDSRSVYGPAFTAIGAGVTSVFSTPASTVFGFKALAAVASVLAMVLTVAAARRAAPERAAFAGVLVGWSPVIVFHGVAGGHNDVLVGLAVGGGGLPVPPRRRPAAPPPPPPGSPAQDSPP